MMTERSESNPGDIEQIRDDIDRIDADILKLLAERKAHSLRIAKEKGIHDRPSRDQAREEGLISDRIAAGMEHDLDSGLVNRVWREIVNDSVRIQQEYLDRLESPAQAVTVAIQGIDGSYSQLAAQQYFDHKGIAVNYVRSPTFAAAIGAVQRDEADVAVLPIENTTSGAISEVYDLLLDSGLHFVGDVRFRIRHCLLGIEGASISDLRRIYCHPQAVAQCSEFLAQLEHVAGAHAAQFSQRDGKVAHLEPQCDFQCIQPVERKLAFLLFGGVGVRVVLRHVGFFQLLKGDARSLGQSHEMPSGWASKLGGDDQRRA